LQPEAAVVAPGQEHIGAAQVVHKCVVTSIQMLAALVVQVVEHYRAMIELVITKLTVIPELGIQAQAVAVVLEFHGTQLAATAGQAVPELLLFVTN
jgi:hypothetical protein